MSRKGYRAHAKVLEGLTQFIRGGLSELFGTQVDNVVLDATIQLHDQVEVLFAGADVDSSGAASQGQG